MLGLDKLTIDKMLVSKHDLKHRVRVEGVPIGTANVWIRPCPGNHVCYLWTAFKDFNAFLTFLFKHCLISVKVDVAFGFDSTDCAKNVW